MQVQQIQKQKQEIKEFVILSYGSIESGGSDRYDYEGKETDSTDLQYFGARYYDPHMRIFTQPDSIIPDVYDPQQLNPYMFERGNPLSYVDEDGHDIIIGIVILAFLAYTVSWASTLFETGSTEQAYESATATGIGTAVGATTASIIGPQGLGISSETSAFIGGVAGIKTKTEVTGEETTKTQEIIAGLTSVISSQVGQYFETQGASELIESIIEPKIENRLNQITDLLKPDESLIINNNANYQLEKEEMITL